MLNCRRFEIDAPKQTIAMRRLLLFRHAKAERGVPGTPDRDRALIDRGRKDAARIGAYMASHQLLPDRVFISPSARTQETWKDCRLGAEAGARRDVCGKALRRDPARHLAVIKDAPASAHTLLMVGHNPGLHELALMLVASGDVEARERLREKLPTCGLVIIDFAFDDWSKLHPQSGRLERFVSPRSLEAAAN